MEQACSFFVFLWVNDVVTLIFVLIEYFPNDLRTLCIDKTSSGPTFRLKNSICVCVCCSEIHCAH